MASNKPPESPNKPSASVSPTTIPPPNVQLAKQLVDILRQGTAAWNAWRLKNHAPPVLNLEGADLRSLDLCEANLSYVHLGWADLRETQLRGADLQGADLTNANLSEANLSEANLSGANLFKIKLHKANLFKANLSNVRAHRANLHHAVLSETDLGDALLSDCDMHRANLSKANLSNANLEKAVLSNANCRGANLRGCDLSLTNLTECKLERADISGCRIYGVSAWNVRLDDAVQSDLIITPKEEPDIKVDYLEVAQFIYLLLNNKKIRLVIDNVTSMVVLILGRFKPGCKKTLETIRDELRARGYCPILFDFEKPLSRDFIETVCSLAHLSKFVVADFTDARIVLEEVPHIVRSVAVPVKPILLEGSEGEPVTLQNLRRNHLSVLPTYLYKNLDDLLARMHEEIIVPAEALAKELQLRV
jgi:uncharacterized protein YjbI with pentapeptide repeats